MRLSKIKIVGFKSFVDPTTITLPSNLVAVVGPNGCGKSNIIDAVTWVMGESSPKYLRGESLTDVIFNGSTARKPVGQASVELMFDNSDGTVGGEYAKYAEISVRRQLNRESDSSYFLNGVRCRKKDIVDIFLGTGLGPRSYSIIGQNMISRVIEAKPDDLRTYLEEAAGISKYKERRHETELRINHTKENVARVNDLRAELEKQLSHLKHQANVAEKYKLLKQQERVLRAELLGSQWRQLDLRLVDYTLKIQREETALEARNSELSGTDREIEQLRHEQRVAQDAFQEVQRHYYAIGNEITRVEQDILHHQERKQQWELDLKQTETDWQSIKDQASEAEDNLRELDRDVENLQPHYDSLTSRVKQSQDQLSQAETAVTSWQSQWDEFNQTSSATAQTAQVEKNRISHLEQQLAFLTKRREQLQLEQSQFNFSELSDAIDVLNKNSYEVADNLEKSTRELADIRKEISTQQGAIDDSHTSLDGVRSELQKLRGEQASLEALQLTALGQRDHAATPWIDKYQLSKNPRLAQQIQVEKGWEIAVEKALGMHLQAICVDNLEQVLPHLGDFNTGNLCVFSNTQLADYSKQAKGTLLLEKINSSLPLTTLLSGVYVADTLDDAIKLANSLSDHESVITKNGDWVNKTWLKVLRDEDPAAGVFQREQELKQLVTRIDNLQVTQHDLEKNIAERREQINKLEERRDELQQTCNQLQSQLAQLQAQHKSKQERLNEIKSQAERCLKEFDENQVQSKQLEQQLSGSRNTWQQAMGDLEHQASTREDLIQARDKSRQELQQQRDALNRLKEEMHQIEIRLQTSKSQKASLAQALSRLHTQLSALHERKTVLQSELGSMPPMDNLQKSLSRALDKHVSIENELNTARVAMESLDHEFRNLEQKRQTIEHDINKIRSALESYRVDWQGWKVKTETILEQIKETEFTLEDILKQLPEEVTPDEWQIKLDQIVNRINRLGPINLVAIDEYATCQERKLYLDKQLEDLQAGLATLEDAILKIDRETRNRFKETFDKVNGRFQELFPTIFGGGKAYLELTSDNLLETGVTMMACPPGKRNSSIYLLSGGEKSLTALALIFSIFYLNPAPFCLLDEVDAALDDANVLRYTHLLKAMSDKTQFIFISHNKIAIETGEYLIGVTMNEPGVSRLVSVDIEKAMSLVEQ